jgi:hypothetical protein
LRGVTPTGHNTGMRPRSPFLVLAVFAASVAAAEEIQKWVDKDGRPHFSNRGEASAPTAPSGEGWESVLERQQGADEFSQRVETAINSLQADRLRKKRERDRANETLEDTQSDIVRVQATQNPTRLPELRAREAQQVAEVGKLSGELAQIDANLERLKAMKSMGREQAEKLGQSPLLQYGH